MIDAKELVLWVNDETRQVRALRKFSSEDTRIIDGMRWTDPIGAAYSEWGEMTTKQQVGLMLETAIDLAMQGYNLGDLLREMAKVNEFIALGSVSYPMCRALTTALLGRCLEPNTMSFEELLVTYSRR